MLLASTQAQAVNLPQEDPAAPVSPATAPAPIPVPPPLLVLPPLASEAPPPAPANPDDSIIVTARPKAPPEDPLQGINVKTFALTQSVDEAVVGPMAMGYKKNVPGPFRRGVRNFLGNLQEPVVFLNYMLQLKPGKGAETLGRFVVNSTLGVAGLFDVAKKKPFHLPRRPNGFGNTLGYYGVKQGAFLYLPLIGPTTIRDLVGRVADLSVIPFAVGKPFNSPYYAIPTTSVRLLDERAEADEVIQARRNSSADPYSDVRKEYLQRRQAEIDALHNRRPVPDPALIPPGQPLPAAD